MSFLFKHLFVLDMGHLVCVILLVVRLNKHQLKMICRYLAFMIILLYYLCDAVCHYEWCVFTYSNDTVFIVCIPVFLHTSGV